MSNRHPKSRTLRRRAAGIFGAFSAAAALLCSGALAEPPTANEVSLQAPESLAKVSQRQAAPAPVVVEVVVKFKDDGKVKDIIDAFWKGPQVAKAKFDIFKRGRPEMAGATLDRVTYSNELVLVYPCAAASKAERAIAMREIVGRLTASSDISYAEPEMTVQTQQ